MRADSRCLSQKASSVRNVRRPTPKAGAVARTADTTSSSVDVKRRTAASWKRRFRSSRLGQAPGAKTSAARARASVLVAASVSADNSRRGARNRSGRNSDAKKRACRRSREQTCRSRRDRGAAGAADVAGPPQKRSRVPLRSRTSSRASHRIRRSRRIHRGPPVLRGRRAPRTSHDPRGRKGRPRALPPARLPVAADRNAGDSVAAVAAGAVARARSRRRNRGVQQLAFALRRCISSEHRARHQTTFQERAWRRRGDRQPDDSS